VSTPKSNASILLLPSALRSSLFVARFRLAGQLNQRRYQREVLGTYIVHTSLLDGTEYSQVRSIVASTSGSFASLTRQPPGPTNEDPAMVTDQLEVSLLNKKAD
jgi:hypothetical protein